jgi:hypothetical chaperone protein
MNKFLYGFDFGTTNSAISIFDEERQEIIDTITVPSILYFPYEQKSRDEIKYFVGNHAVNEYINDSIKGRFMKSIKRVLPRSSFTETRIGAFRFTASDLVSLIIKDLKAKADSLIGYDCQKAVIGRPIFFDDDNTSKDQLAERRLQKAFEKANLTNVVFQYEPIGAAFAYEKYLTKKEKVLVADFGGGTTDFSFIELDPAKIGTKNRRDDIIATGGIYVGGDSFDSSFMWERGTPHFGKGVLYESMPGKMLELPLTFFSNICSWEKLNFFDNWKIKNKLNSFYKLTGNNAKFRNLITLTENNLGYSIFQSVEKTKIDLSAFDNSDFIYSKMGIKINENISIIDYNQIINKEIVKINNYLDQFLLRFNISDHEIDSIFLTGGSSLVREIKNMFKMKFPHVPIHSGDNFISVSKGLAFSGYLFD